MKAINEMAQWGVIGLILWLLLGLDFDILKESTKRISTLESQITEQRRKISTLEEKISDINHKLQSVATVDDLKDLQDESSKLEAVPIASNQETQVTSRIGQLVGYYNKSQVWINLAAAALLAIILLVLISRRKINSKPKAQVANLKPVPKGERAVRECA